MPDKGGMKNAQDIQDDRREAREVLGSLDPRDHAIAASLQAALTDGNPHISDVTHEAKDAAGMLCDICGVDILPGTGQCSRGCWEEGGGAS